MKYAKLNYDLQKAVEETLNPRVRKIDIVIDGFNLEIGSDKYYPFITMQEFHEDSSPVKIVLLSNLLYP